MEVVPASELVEWQAYYEIEPFGEVVDDFRAGMITAMVANTTRKKTTDRVFKPTDFMPNFKEPEHEDAPETLSAKVSALKAIYGNRSA